MPITQLRQFVITIVSLTAILSILIGCSDEASTPSGLSGDSWEEVLTSGSGTLVALYVPADGFAFRDEDDNLTGVTVDLLKAFADYLRDQYKISLHVRFEREDNWRRFYNLVAGGDDGLIGMGNVTITEPRREELQFSPPYLYNIAVLITNASTPELTSLRQLENTFSPRQALAFSGTLHEERLRTITQEWYPGAGFRFVESNDEIIASVATDDQYFAYIDVYNYWRAAAAGLPVQRHAAADESAEQFGYIMPLTSTWGDILEEFFDHDGGLLQSDLYREILVQHLGEELAELLIQSASDATSDRP